MIINQMDIYKMNGKDNDNMKNSASKKIIDTKIINIFPSQGERESPLHIHEITCTCTVQYV